KALMAELSDASIAMPGGLGTLEEFCEILTWSQLGYHRKPCALLNVEKYFDPLLSLFDHAVSEGFVYPAHRDLILHYSQSTAPLDSIALWKAPKIKRWIGGDETYTTV